MTEWGEGFVMGHLSAIGWVFLLLVLWWASRDDEPQEEREP